MNHDEILTLEDQFQIPTYAKIPLAIERGDGPFVWDASGDRYIDFYGGHCVSILGHSPKPVVAAIKSQADKILFYSNLVYNSTRAQPSVRHEGDRTRPDDQRRVDARGSGFVD